MKEKSIPTQYFKFLIILFSLVSGAVAGHAEVVDRVVAIVNDDCIALSELNERLEPYARRIDEEGYPTEAKREMLFKLREDVLNKMIDEKLTSQESERLKVTVDDNEVDQQIEQIKKKYLLTDEELRKSLAAEGHSMEEYRDRLKAQILQMKLVNIEVTSKIAITDKDIQHYYEEHKAEYEETQTYRLGTILIKAPPSASPDEREAARAVMEMVVNALKSGAAFDELARKYSDGPSAQAGGDLGQFRLDELSEQFRETVRTMSEGQVSPVLETADGYRILIVQEIEKKPGREPKEATLEIHEKLYQKFVDEQYKAWIKRLRDRSYVRVIL